MRSWVQLLLLLLAACPRFVVAEGEPLPVALVELVRDTPISSIQDLQRLLLSDSTDEEGNSAAAGGHRSPRSLGAEPAQQALCKVRTEVVEVTRSMLDRSNANFLLWPPCVEVQRCSGCCNTKSLQCVPSRTNTRYLQVMKVEYINMSPTYAKAVVSVVDHVECRCQAAPAPKKKSSRRQNGPHKEQHWNQTVSHEQVKVHSKDELHHRDGLKQNQGSHLQDLLQHHWSPRGDTFTHGGFSLAKGNQHGEPALDTPRWTYNSTGQLGGNKSEELVEAGLTGTEGNTSEGGEDRSLTPQAKPGPSQATVLSRFRPTKEPNPDPRRENDTPEEESILKLEEKILEQERRELLLLHQRLDQEKELLRQKKREELHTTLRPVTGTTQKPVAPAAPRPPAHPKRRMRKNRRRISKAAMRAMLM
ncbi:platelet-derived growth factor subunit B isoform X1 [Synchiropus splendidus]|uniref:platelet-derived growth factor subunit B isoform X1 n=1 Tax=Synchiropus splendidus TaxID=270530 RepID=UPI00237EE5C9|nr:platelet-derived growth factor subunit B isoform X1 [Synchiropus splendidus]